MSVGCGRLCSQPFIFQFLVLLGLCNFRCTLAVQQPFISSKLMRREKHKLASLSGLSVSISDSTCEVNGLWSDDGGTPEIRFAANRSSLELVFQGLAPVTIQYNESDSSLLSMSIGSVKARTEEEFESTKMRTALYALKDAAEYTRMKRFSSTLGRNDLDGGKGSCLINLHSVLLGLPLIKEHELPVDSDALEDKMVADDDEEMGEDMESQEADAAGTDVKDANDPEATGKLKLILRRKISTGDTSDTGYGRRRRDDRRRRTGWSGYGFGPDDTNGCPAAPNSAQPQDWECRVEPSLLVGGRRRRSPGPWYQAGSEELGGHHNNQYVDVECEGSTANPECTGLCGAGCDCWESICGSSYKCDYNPSCCAHDKTCARRRVGSYTKCLNAAAVQQACGR